ncbi:MAG: glycosyltransferase family 2 protein [Candidatus Methylomirabilis oxyfera]|nr:glycosyltransferase family 2 protein [Candidatus Methylomirabilis oxyfera]
MSQDPFDTHQHRVPLTFIIPAYNEEAILAANVDRLRGCLKDREITAYELLLVSNGSTDRTVEIARTCAVGRNDLQVIDLDQRGVGRAFKAGMARAQYDRVVCLDLDLTIDLDFITVAAAALETADIVIGSKQTGGQQRSWVRQLASAAFIACTRRLLHLEFTDYSIGAKAFRADSIRSYLPHLAEQSAYILQLITWGQRDGAVIVEVPVWCDDRRKSRFNLLHEGLYRFGSLFLLWLQERMVKGTRRDRS